MIRVNTHEAKTKLSMLLSKVELDHEEVVICRNGKPVAKLVGAGTAHIDHFKTDPDLVPIVIHGDPCAPLDEEDWPEEYR
jgi:prevent-host-death family protein